MSLLEIANLASKGRLKTSLDELFYRLESNPFFQVLPLDYEVAGEVALLRSTLRDPADCVIVATARVHALRLVTSDQRIIASKLVAVVE
jgi:PIN domain nuclease of toxin-antitoxin system